MEFSEKDKRLSAEITSFLKKRKNDNYFLWDWAVKVPLEQRIKNLFSKNSKLSECYFSNNKFIENGSVLDVGCGFCAYWPFLEKLGYNKFLGYDLYSKRGFGNQEYMKTARLLVEEFCQDCDFIIVEDDIRNISSFRIDDNNLNFEHSGDISFFKPNNFDLIFTKNTNYQKLGSTGVPESIFEEACRQFLKPKGIKLYAG